MRDTVTPLRPARVLTISIAAPAASVYAFISDPRRIPEWAAGLGSAPTPLPDGAWRLETSVGPMRVTFAPMNALGVADHVVTPLDGKGAAVDVPLRVIPNGSGSEVMLTLFRQPAMSDAQFAADAVLVQADLARLKNAVEKTQNAEAGE
jgi:carbon monoxide dehydrogenase subunit G